MEVKYNNRAYSKGVIRKVDSNTTNLAKDKLIIPTESFQKTFDLLQGGKKMW